MAVVVAVVAHIMHACMHTLCRNSHSRIWPNPRVQSPVSSVQSQSPVSKAQLTMHCRPSHLPYALWQCRVSYLANRSVGPCTCHTHYGSAGFRTSRRPVGLRTCHTQYGSAGFRTSQRLLPLLPLLPLHNHAMFVVPHLMVSLIKLVSCCWGLIFLIKYDKRDVVFVVLHEVVVLQLNW